MSKSRREGFILAYSLSVQSIIAVVSLKQELIATYHFSCLCILIAIITGPNIKYDSSGDVIYTTRMASFF